MSLRGRLRSVFEEVNRPFGWYAAKDHPADGGITGEEYHEGADE